MSAETAAGAVPAFTNQSSTLAPPPNPSRPTSAHSNRSNSSRRSRTQNPSPNISRSNSNSSRGPSEGEDKAKKSGSTTTISGGTSLGPKDGVDNPGKARKARGEIRDRAESPVTKGQKGQARRSSTNAVRRPNPIITARPLSQNSNPVANPSDNGSQSAPNPLRSIHTAITTPRTAMEAAVDAATKKHNAMSGGDALASLQKMISDLKGIPPAAASSGGTAPGSRSTSGVQDTPVPAQPVISPVPIPTSANSKKLKADAPSFTPSFQAASLSPAASHQSISPGVANATFGVQPKATSHAAVRRASSSSNSNGTMASFNTMPNLNAASSGQVYPNPMTQFPSAGSYQSHLHAHPEAANEDLSALAYTQHANARYQHQQLLAAQHLQYQQIQLLQAQLAAQQQAQQAQQAQQQQQATTATADGQLYRAKIPSPCSPTSGSSAAATGATTGARYAAVRNCSSSSSLMYSANRRKLRR